MKLDSGILEFLVFKQLPDQIPSGIFLFGIGVWWLLMHGKQAAALDIDKRGRHYDELAGNLEIQHSEGIEIFKVLTGDPFDRNRINVALFLFDQIKKEIQWSFEHFNFNFVIRRQGEDTLADCLLVRTL